MKDLSSQRVNGGVYDVISYGADPTGTNDSYTAFQAAADAAVSYAATNKRATLLIPGGSYKLSNTFKVIGGNVTVDARGAYIFASSNKDLFRDWTSQDTSYTLNGSGLMIVGGIWDCKGQNWGDPSNATLDAGGFSAFTLANSSNVTIRDVTVRNIYNYHGIDINTCKGVSVEGCRFEGFRNNFDWHTDCVAATTANRTLSGLTSTSLDGVTPTAGQRILVKNQTTASQNGIYAAASGSWTRVTDMDAAGEAQRAAVKVTSGTTLGGTAWYQTANNPTPGSASMTWAQVTNAFNGSSRYFSEAVQIDDGDNNIVCKDITVNNCYMGPATDGSGLGSFGKLAGTHTDQSGQLYENIKVTNSTSVGSLSNAIQGYSWSDSVISNNVILDSEERGIRFFFASNNSGPRLNINGNIITNSKMHGIEIDGGSSQVFNDVSIVGNTITSSVMNAGTGSVGIRVDTCDRLVCSANMVNLTGSPSANQGIYIITVNDGLIEGNNVIGAGAHGMQFNACTRSTISNNRIYNVQFDGVYIAAGTSRCFVSSNHIVGAGRASTTYGGVTFSNNAANADNCVMGNRIQKFGSGNEAASPIKFEGTSTANTNTVVFNSFEGWGTTKALSDNSTTETYDATMVNAVSTYANNATA